VADQCGLVELIGTLLVRHGTPDQQKLLPDILAMRKKVAFCISEPEAGTDVSGVQWLLANMAKDVEAARRLVFSVAHKLDHDEDATKTCSIVKCFASDMAVQRT
jgi:alkylation response protein AidB-like acyl-CoA dehydrogenase